MSFRDKFCSSPWFHMQITNSGDMKYCRWALGSAPLGTVYTQTPQQVFQESMEPVRQQLLQGQAPDACKNCHKMEQHSKVSGRQRQLLKTGIRLEEFDKTLLSSPWLPVFEANLPQMPQDWQIDLGNYCNSACVMCSPRASSRIAKEQQKLKLISPVLPQNWSDSPESTQKVIDALLSCDNLKYVHFIGGETVITPVFKKILQAMVNNNKHRTVTVGLTTNLTVWSQSIVSLLTQFQSVHLGVSIETFSAVNDYIRWPSKIDHVVDNLQRWLDHARRNNWLVQARITPTVLSIHELITVYDWAWHNSVPVESCNFLLEPAYLRPSVLPMNLRWPIVEHMKQWIDSHQFYDSTVLNTRHPDLVKSQICQDLGSYVKYLTNQPDESYRLPDLAQYLTLIESVRGNRVLDYIPQYEELFRAAGYQR